MTQIVLSPCSPFSVTADLLRNTAELAHGYDSVGLHTHLAETLDEEEYTLERYGQRPVEWMETVDWLGDDVWFAHAVHVNNDAIRRMAATGTGVASLRALHEVREGPVAFPHSDTIPLLPGKGILRCLVDSRPFDSNMTGIRVMHRLRTVERTLPAFSPDRSPSRRHLLRREEIGVHDVSLLTSSVLNANRVCLVDVAC